MIILIHRRVSSCYVEVNATFSNWKPAFSEVDQPSIPLREDLKEDSPDMLQQFRDEYLTAYASVDPTGAHVMCNSHIFEAVIIACTNWTCLGGILYKLAHYMFGLPSDPHFLPSSTIEFALAEASWSADYIADAERFTPPSTESKEHWKMKYDSYL